MKLALLDFGEIATTDAAGVRRRVPVPGALIVTDDGSHVLVDTGMPARYIGNSDLIPNKADRMTAVMEERHTARHQLSLLGLRAADIDYVIATHFDWDQAGANADFPGATFYVQRTHLEAARADPERFWPELWDVPGLCYEVIDGDAEPIPGIQSLETGGHVPGHQSVVVRLPQTGQVILAIDAIKSWHQLDDCAWETPAFAQARRSGERLATLAREAGNSSLLIFSHDADQWAALRHAPEWYE
ncbi:MAG: N-acyl homoserine lactonase family protein [Chloroflexota bacterium]